MILRDGPLAGQETDTDTDTDDGYALLMFPERVGNMRFARHFYNRDGLWVRTQAPCPHTWPAGEEWRHQCIRDTNHDGDHRCLCGERGEP